MELQDLQDQARRERPIQTKPDRTTLCGAQQWQRSSGLRRHPQSAALSRPSGSCFVLQVLLVRTPNSIVLELGTLADIDGGTVTLTLEGEQLKVDVFERTFLHDHLIPLIPAGRCCVTGRVAAALGLARMGAGEVAFSPTRAGLGRGIQMRKRFRI